MSTQLRVTRQIWLWLLVSLLAHNSNADTVRHRFDGKRNNVTVNSRQAFTSRRNRLTDPKIDLPDRGNRRTWLAARVAPVITVMPSSLTFLNSTQLPGSLSKTYTVSATGLTTSDFRVTVPSPFVVSAPNGGTYPGGITLPVNSDGTLNQTTITVALLSSSPGTFAGTISNISGSTTATVAVSGTTVSPSLSVSPPVLNNFSTTTGTASAVQTYTITALSQTGGVVTAPAGVEIRTGSGAFGSSLTIPGSLSTATISVDVRLTGTTATQVSGSITHRLNNSSNQSVANVAVSGTVSDPAVPTISVTPSSLTVADYSEYPGSFPASFTVSASGLTADLEIVAPPYYLLSANGRYGPALLIPASGGAVPPTSVSIALIASSPGVYAGTLVSRSGATTATIPLSGTALAQSVTVSPTALSNFTTTFGTPSASQSYTVTTRGGLPVYVGAPAGFEIRSGNSPFSSSLVIGTSPSFVNTPVDVRLIGDRTGPVSGTITQNTYFHSSHLIYPVAVSGFVAGSNTGLTVLHRDVDNYADNNAIQPLLVLQNQGAGTLPLANLTLRYYLTVEGAAALSNLSVNYAQVGNQNVRLRYVPLQPTQPGASGYVEYSFTPAAGSLAPGASSGPIQSYVARSDYAGLNERDDYSYATVRDQLVGNLRITAYYNGVLIAGVEPGVSTPVRALRALTESKNGPSATQINTYLTVRNEGNVPVNYSDLKARYYFTADGPERLQLAVDEGNVQVQLVKIDPPLANADTYLELSFLQGGQLAAGASTGQIRYRISKPDGGRFNQRNDYSYQEQPTELSSNNRVLVYAGTDRLWGQEPGASARMVATEPGSQLEVVVLGNPVRGGVVSVQIKSAGSEPLQVQVANAQGRIINQRHVANPQPTEQHQLVLGEQGSGLFLLQVRTPTQSRTIRVLTAD
ncbi:cellulose binding domain-containing protein [uncultured Fibrella sp.]|uniref:cellulose binding domain-containing protein n=1 Tax=uncultured Fibrella sp. TaxID=1284596 RepID=UPI0035C9509F